MHGIKARGSGGGGGGGSVAYSTTVGDGAATSFVVTHSLGTADVHVMVWDLSGADPVLDNGAPASIEATDANSVTVAFGAAPTSGQYRITVLSAGGAGGGIAYPTSVDPDALAGLWSWYRAEDLALSDGASVVTWADASGNGRDLSGGSGTVEFLTYGWPGTKELGAVRFAGGYRDATGQPASGNGARALFAVLVPSQGTPVAQYEHVCHWGTASAGQSYGLATRNHLPSGSERAQRYLVNHLWTSREDFGVNPTGAVVVGIMFDGTTSSFWMNGAQVWRAAATYSTGTSVGLRVGAGIGVAVSEVGRFSTPELGFYSAAPTKQEFHQLHIGLMEKYGILI